MATTQNKELYDQIRAQVIEELKEERREKAKQRKQLHEAAWEIFAETRKEYLPKLVAAYGHKTGRYGEAITCRTKIYDTELSALAIAGEKNHTTAYLNGKQEEANKALRQLLDNILKDLGA